MQKIAAMLEKGETDAAFRALEELLYTGNGEQRQQALKWLERLYPKKITLGEGGAAARLFCVPAVLAILTY